MRKSLLFALAFIIAAIPLHAEIASKFEKLTYSNGFADAYMVTDININRGYIPH
jgi:hypothetical protein